MPSRYIGRIAADDAQDTAYYRSSRWRCTSRRQLPLARRWTLANVTHALREPLPSRSFWKRGKALIIYSAPDKAVHSTARINPASAASSRISPAFNVELLKSSIGGKRES